MSLTRVVEHMITLSSGRTFEDKVSDIISCLDYGATIAGSAAANTTAINTAITAAAVSGAGGYVLIPPGISYTESSLVISANITVIIFGTDGRITFLTADTGDTPLSKSGIAIKQQGVSGVLLRAIDFGVSAEPFLQIVDLATGDIAAVHSKFVEMDEISAPANPSANKSRVYTKDNGSGNTQLVVQFPTGAVIPLATEGRSANLKGTVTYDPGSLLDAAGATTTVSVTGAILGDIVLVSFDKDLQGITLSGYVSSANTVSVRFQNESGGTLDLASGTLTALVLRNY